MKVALILLGIFAITLAHEVVEDSGKYLADDSGKYKGDDSGKYVPEKEKIPEVLRPKRQADLECKKNGYPCHWKGVGGFTNCCTKYCFQMVEESMGRCADPPAAQSSY